MKFKTVHGQFRPVFSLEVWAPSALDSVTQREEEDLQR